jgi:hypothetical protein
MNGQIIYDLALVQDRGTHWFVTNVTQNTLDNLADKDEKILKLSYMSHQLIKEALMSGKKVHVQKSALRTNEVLPGEFTIIDGVENNELESLKESSIIKVRMLVTPELAKISGFSMYGFIVLNNDLSNVGYFITNENREEKYLEILETGDEQLIQKLEDYLNYKDEIEQLASLERKFSKFKKDIIDCDSQESIKTLEEDFLEKFYNGF